MKMSKACLISSRFNEQTQATYQLQQQIIQKTYKQQSTYNYDFPLLFKGIILQQIWLKHSNKSFFDKKQSFEKQILIKQKILKHQYLLRWQFKIKSRQFIKSTLSDILCQQSVSKGSFLYRLKGLIQRQKSLIKDTNQINQENTLRGVKNRRTQAKKKDNQYQSKKPYTLNEKIQNKQIQLQNMQLVQQQVEGQEIKNYQNEQQSQIIIGQNQNQQNDISIKQATWCHKIFLQQQKQHIEQIPHPNIQQLDQKLKNKQKITKFLYKHDSMVQKLRYQMNDEFRKINSIIKKIQVIANKNKK